MLDRFPLTHHEITPHDPPQDQEFFPKDTLRNMRTFATFPIGIPSLYNIPPTSHVQTYEKLFALHLTMSNAAYLSRLASNERQLAEIIILHKLMHHFDSGVTAQNRTRALSALGHIVLQHLTSLLLNLHHEEYDRLFELGRANGFNQGLWENYFIGAATRARTISTFLETEMCKLYFPTAFEDIILGIDLFVLDDFGNDWCVAMKSGRPEFPMHVEFVHTRPHDEDPAFAASCRRRIFDATKEMELLCGGHFLPCRMIIGKMNGKPYDLHVYPEDVTRLQNFMTINRSRAHTKQEANAPPSCVAMCK